MICNYQLKVSQGVISVKIPITDMVATLSEYMCLFSNTCTSWQAHTEQEHRLRVPILGCLL